MRERRRTGIAGPPDEKQGDPGQPRSMMTKVPADAAWRAGQEKRETAS